MDPELKSLSDAIQSYKKSLIARLDQIDNDLQYVMADIQTPTTVTASVKKYEISMQMVKMLPHYLKMLEMGKSLADDFASKLCQLERDLPPEKDRKSSNPFLTDMLEKNDDANEPNLCMPLDKKLCEPKCSETAALVPEINQEPKHTQVQVERKSEFNVEPNSSHRVTEVPATTSEIKQEPSCSPLGGCDVNAKTFVPKNWTDRVLKLLDDKDRKGKRSPNKDKSVIVELPQDDLNVGQTCVITYVVSPSEFYIQYDPSLLEIVETSFNDELNRHSVVTNKYASKKEASHRLGDFCFAYLAEKKKNFRVQILDWLVEETDLVSIQLVDHGIKLNCSYKKLRNMSKLYALFPKMATRCHLAGIYSPNPHSDTKWLKASIDFFAAICEVNQKTKFSVIYAYNEGNSYAVDLQKESDLNADSFGEILVKKGYARQEVISDARSDDEFEDVDNINELIAGYDATDEARICPFTDNSGRCFKGSSCKFEHEKLSKDGVTTDRVFALSQATLVEPMIPVENQTVEVLITGYVDTCNFYAQILNKRSNDNLYNDDFQKLQENMKSNNLVSTYESFKIYPGISEFVLVKEGFDWYRGSCTGYTECDKIEVFFVDFGYKKDIKLKDIRQMKEDFLLVPFQAVECMIHDSQERKDVDGAVSSDFFYDYMYMEIFTAHVIELGKPLMVQLWGSNGVDISEILKQWGLAEDRIDLRPAKDCPMSCY